MHSNNYIHGDLHNKNIGVVLTNKKYINILKHKIQTFGYIYKAIDFGLSVNKKDLINNNPKNLIVGNEKNYYENTKKSEISVLSNFFITNNFWKYIENTDIKINTKNYYTLVEETNEFKILNNILKDKHKKHRLFYMLFPEIYQKILLGKKYKKFIPEKLRIPIEDIIFAIKAGDDYLKIINYFIFKL